MDQFNIDIVSNDFKVEPMVIEDDFAILLGVRSLLFHFVVIQVEGTSNFRHFSTYQFHLHIFDVANEFRDLKNQVKNNTKKEWIRNTVRDALQLSLDPEMNLWITIDYLGFEVEIKPETGQWFLDVLEKEINLVESSIRYLSSKKNQVKLLKKLQLPEEGEYDFTSIVWRCIQFEMNLFARSKNKSRGIRMLYPKLLNGNTELSERDLDQITKVLHHFDPFCTCDFCTENAEVFDKVHEMYFPQKSYIRGKRKLDSDHIRECVRLMYDKLSSVDKLSLTYLLDYSPSALVTLTYLSGIRTEQSLISLVCGDVEPDSKVEQKTREQISLISWFRKIAET